MCRNTFLEIERSQNSALLTSITIILAKLIYKTFKFANTQ